MATGQLKIWQKLDKNSAFVYNSIQCFLKMYCVLFCTVYDKIYKEQRIKEDIL